jgi:hypothetical protein
LCVDFGSILLRFICVPSLTNKLHNSTPQLSINTNARNYDYYFLHSFCCRLCCCFCCRCWCCFFYLVLLLLLCVCSLVKPSWKTSLGICVCALWISISRLYLHTHFKTLLYILVIKILYNKHTYSLSLSFFKDFLWIGFVEIDKHWRK